MGCNNVGPRRRVFSWPQEAKQLAADYPELTRKRGKSDEAERRRLVAKLVELSGNPRDACQRFLRRLGVGEKRSYREWTKPEQQRLADLIDTVPVEEAARLLRRSGASVRSMLHRLGLAGRQGREWFTLSLLASALHVGRDQVQTWIARGWLPCRVAETQGAKIKIIDPDDFAQFIKQHGREVAGRRLTYDGLLFVRNYVFPPKHADMLSVRKSYKKRVASVSGARREDSLEAIGGEDEKDPFDQSA